MVSPLDAPLPHLLSPDALSSFLPASVLRRVLVRSPFRLSSPSGRGQLEAYSPLLPHTTRPRRERPPPAGPKHTRARGTPATPHPGAGARPRQNTHALPGAPDTPDPFDPSPADRHEPGDEPGLPRSRLFFHPGCLDDWGAPPDCPYTQLHFSSAARVFVLLPSDMREPRWVRNGQVYVWEEVLQVGK